MRPQFLFKDICDNKDMQEIARSLNKGTVILTSGRELYYNCSSEVYSFGSSLAHGCLMPEEVEEIEIIASIICP